MTLTNLLSRLDQVRQTRSNQWMARCPAHGDKHPSLAIRELADGRTLIHCHAGCDTFAIVSAVGLELSDLFPPRIDDDKRPTKERRPFHVADALRLIDHEIDDAARLIAVCANSPDQFTPERRTRLMQRANSVRQARIACGLREVQS